MDVGKAEISVEEVCKILEDVDSSLVGIADVFKVDAVEKITALLVEQQFLELMM